MAKSILQTQRECYYCGDTRDLELHHVFGGANRKKSTRYGLTLYLCRACHNEPPHGVHFDIVRNYELKRMGQQAFERIYGHGRFMEEFGKNYL